ncbi:hypothetical protein P280DRAFT_520336 [Massarina eburnea CBS 473.64]|uniref:Cell surface spherulin 4-like protein n=1 Tax=Massarina eburnea CBS 473.64 TaxID=1395130 RepID=A0A6A6RVS9_9PLEO|nr:hypothetical protein P280DRAFT_520336 [Massarina eburnea CBS 473.64]
MDVSVILPLYIFPSPGAWDRFYELASLHPRIQFTAIVNPNSGPGEDSLPNEHYMLGIRRLHAFGNVRVVGYVPTTWCMKNLSLVLYEIAAYSRWGELDSSLALNGIFFDETPTSFTTENMSFLRRITNAVRASPGLKEAYVVHNPGALPDEQYLREPDFADLTVIFEDTYSNWTARADSLIQATQSCDHVNLALILHSVPALSRTDAESIIREAFMVGHSIWLTSTRDYTALDSHFSVLVDNLDALSRQVGTLGPCSA